jgi:hypothetical protein
VCDSNCPFCSIQDRPLKSKLSFDKIQKALKDFKYLGAKSLEITGGGNPMLYRDEDKDINDIIDFAHTLGYEIGIITNSHNLSKIKSEHHHKIKWIRISLIKIDEGITPEDYNFNNFPIDRLGFSYIIYDGTTEHSIDNISKLIILNPKIKFVRLAGNCLIKGNNDELKIKFKKIINQIDIYERIFFNEIGEGIPYDDGCFIGMIKPYIAPNPKGGDYRVYVCTSHILTKQNYDLDYSLCSVNDIIPSWNKMNDKHKRDNFPYEIKNNNGKNWCDTCKFCYYNSNNQLLHSICIELEDKNFT